MTVLASGCGPKGRVVAGADLLYLEGATLIDGTGAPPRPGAVIVIEGDKIADVGSRGEIHVPASARRRDLSGRFVIPGLICMSTQLERAAGGRSALRAMLEAGITTVRASGESAGALVALRGEVASGAIPGPRLLVIGAAHATDEAGLRREIRSLARAGADAVRLDAGFPAGLIHAAVEESHAQGLQAIGRFELSLWTQVAAEGVDTLERVPIENDPLLADLTGPASSEMIWTVAQQAVSVVVDPGASAGAAQLARALHDAGVVLLAGSDPHRELEQLVQAGIAPLDALTIATRNGAEALGLHHETGTVQPGRRADLVVLGADPAAGLAAVRNTSAIVLIVQAGRLIERH